MWDHLAFDAEDFVPLLDAMQADDVLAQMVFRSACVCDLQLKLLKAAVALGRQALAEHLYALLQSNSLSADRWGKYPEEFQAVMEENHTSQPKDTTIYHYCTVQVDNSRPYEKAISLLHKGDAYAARDCLQELGDYKDSATILA